MDSATLPGDSDSDGHTPLWGLRPADLDEAPAAGPHIMETISISARNGESSGTKAPVSAADCDSGNGDDETDSSFSGKMSSRAYQLEMLDESLKRNVIVAMDTGSGKTQVAILRIKAELEKCIPEKIIWFLAPTKALCAQQFGVIQLQASSVPMRLLTGDDNLDTWEAALWKAVLSGSRILVSTYQVLLDALAHAYVKMADLALIVFDEAHNCTRKHPGSKIMTDFYHPTRASGTSVPTILGLTASPLMRSQIEDLAALEATLHAKCVSPTLHREELVKHVKKPQICYLTYEYSAVTPTEIMTSLRNAYTGLKISEDPYIRSLLSNLTDRNRRALEKAVERYDTPVQNKMRKLCARADNVARELGPWAADQYIYTAVTRYLERMDDSDGDAEFFERWIDEDKIYLSEALRKVQLARPSESPQAVADLGGKVKLLLHELVSVKETFVGIVFVKERDTVSMLRNLLLSIPGIKDKYRIGTVMGTSNRSAKTKSVYEFLDRPDHTALQNFRSGKINLVIATSVLEEGIDVPACNFVICFDTPANTKSFIQRRGRARMRDSKLILFLEASSGKLPRHWMALEEEMKRQYQDEERELKELEMIEESERTGQTFFIVPETGARLDFDNAKSHVDHFCKVLSQGEFVDSRPDYVVTREDGHNGQTRLRCTVLLPAFLPVKLRQATSASLWLSEKNATKDAAFQAYRALHEGGLVNNNLQPFKQSEIPGVEGRASEVAVELPLKPWKEVAQLWKESGDRWLYSVRYVDEDQHVLDEYAIVLPVQLWQPPPMQIFLRQDKMAELVFSAGQRVTAAMASQTPDHTSTLLALHFMHRWPIEEQQHVIQTIVKHDGDVSMKQIGSVRFNPDDQKVTGRQYLIRDHAKTPYLYAGILPHKPPADRVQHTFYEYEKAPADVPYLHLTKWTRRSDFLHRIHSDSSLEIPSTKQYGWVLPQSWATVDTIPAKYAEFGMLLPSVMHNMEVMLVAKHLADTLLHSVNIENLELLREAIISRSASEPVNYERLEFLGDSILKYCTSIQASADRPEWPEGYLSFFRDRLIANSRLSRAALEKGLSKYIVNKAFTGQKWRPMYVNDLLGNDSKSRGPERRLSTKTLADVVESIIGASFQDGGIVKATASICLFLDEIKWRSVDDNRDILFSFAKGERRLPSVLEPLEQLIGYSFQKKSLLMEAMTHASYVADTDNRSLERLEFIGDSILDNIIVTKIFAVQPPLSHHEMHMLKTATVNSDFLAFIVLEHGLHLNRTAVTEGAEPVEEDVFFPLWKFMRHASMAIGLEQAATVKRHEKLRGEILSAMESGTHYPWALLARLQAKKFFSDLFEALLGAVWIDSGSMEPCISIATQFGILPYLDRMLRDKVHVQHPKEELGKWAVTETVTYDISVVEETDGNREYRCRVRVGSRVVTEVDKGVSREEVKTKAAEEAVKVFTKEKEARSPS